MLTTNLPVPSCESSNNICGYFYSAPGSDLFLVSGRDCALSVAADLHHVRVQRGDGLHRHPQQEHHHLHQDQARHQAPVHCGTLSVAELTTLEMLDETGPVWNRSWIKNRYFSNFQWRVIWVKHSALVARTVASVTVSRDTSCH